jgi:SAM-dependent methyltransferase
VPTATIVVGDALALDAADSYDLIYARDLLAHLPDVERAIRVWCAALAPGGVLVLEEPESIASTDPDFARYEHIASGLVQARSGVFYAGDVLAQCRGVARRRGGRRAHHERRDRLAGGADARP